MTPHDMMLVMIERHTLAYLAGVIDGEASVYSPVSGRTRLSIGHTCYPMLEFCQSLAGGVVRVNKGWPVCSANCTSPHVHSRVQKKVWAISGTRAEVVLANVFPYLIVKRAKVSVILEKATVRLPSKYTKTQQAKVLLDMEERGWDLGTLP